MTAWHWIAWATFVVSIPAALYGCGTRSERRAGIAGVGYLALTALAIVCAILAGAVAA